VINKRPFFDLPAAGVCISIVAIAWGVHPASATDAEVTRLLRDGRDRYSKGDYVAAERSARQADVAAKGSLAKDDVNRVYIDLLLGQILVARGDYPGAKASFESGLAWLEAADAYGADHPALVGPLSNLADLFILTGDFARAEKVARRAVEVNARHPDVGPTHWQTAKAMHNLASVYTEKGDFTTAEELLKKVIDIKRDTKQETADPLAVVVSLEELAGVYFKSGAYAKAEPLHPQILASRERHSGPDHPETARVINNAARLYRAMGRYEKAEPLQRRAGDIFERVFPAEHPRVAHAASNLGELLLSVGKHAEARKLFEKSAAVRDKVLGPANPLTSISWQNLAFAAAAGGDWAAAIDAADRGRRGVRRHVARVLPALTDREQVQFLKVRDEANLHGVLSLGLQRGAAQGAAAGVGALPLC
jgi:tetratricopeptide (TPR) repeat protein